MNRKYFYMLVMMLLVILSPQRSECDDFTFSDNLSLRIHYRGIDRYSIPDSATTATIKSNMNFTADCRRFPNPTFSFAFYDSASVTITGNFNIADSVMFLSDLKERKSYFKKVPTGLWNALYSVIADSTFANKDTVFVPDSIGQELVTAKVYEYKGFIVPEMSTFDERHGYIKFLLYYPPSANVSALRNAMSGIGVLFE